MVAAKHSVIPEFSGKLELSASPYGGDTMVDDFSLVESTYTNKNSLSELRFTGLKTSSGIQTANLKSIEGLTTWLMEEAEELVDDGTDTEACTFDKIDDSIRTKGATLRTILTWNPTDEESFVYKRFFKERGVDITFNGVKDDVLYIYTTYHDNLENLNQSFVDKAERVKNTNLARYNHIYLGIPIKENANALWKKRTMIDPYRVDKVPDLKRIAIGVDPAVTSTGKQDETGIVVAGVGYDNRYYIIDDATDLYSTSEWGKASVGAYKKWNADRLIGEVNQGGDLVEMNIQNTDSTVPVKKVHATRGKLKRAEPISALYEDGKVSHVGHLSELEDEMCSYTGDNTDDSPNRLDAMVWVMAFLSQHEQDEPWIMQL
jgi:phage terminase large subunit-like protein